MMWLALMLSCSCKLANFERRYCDEVEKCFPDEECAWAKWRDDPRCEGCELIEESYSLYPVCDFYLRARAQSDGCVDTDIGGSNAESACVEVIVCPDDAPAECTPGFISNHLNPP